jgi:hypothetical protein
LEPTWLFGPFTKGRRAEGPSPGRVANDDDDGGSLLKGTYKFEVA